MAKSKDSRIEEIESYLRSSVPLNVACQAAGVSREQLSLWMEDEIIKARLNTAEAQAYAQLIKIQHGNAIMGEPRPLQELLTKRWQIGGVAQDELITKIISVAERALPTEWFEVFLKALEDSEI